MKKKQNQKRPMKQKHAYLQSNMEMDSGPVELCSRNHPERFTLSKQLAKMYTATIQKLKLQIKITHFVK